MTDDYSYDCADIQTIEASQIRTNMTYDAAVTPDADRPVILNRTWVQWFRSLYRCWRLVYECGPGRSATRCWALLTLHVENCALRIESDVHRVHPSRAAEFLDVVSPQFLTVTARLPLIRFTQNGID